VGGLVGGNGDWFTMAQQPAEDHSTVDDARNVAVYSYRLNGLLSVYHGWLDRAVGDATIDASSRRPKDRVARLRYTARRASVTVYDSVAVLQREKATVLRQSMK